MLNSITLFCGGEYLFVYDLLVVALLRMEFGPMSSKQPLDILSASMHFINRQGIHLRQA